MMGAERPTSRRVTLYPPTLYPLVTPGGSRPLSPGTAFLLLLEARVVSSLRYTAKLNTVTATGKKSWKIRVNYCTSTANYPTINNYLYFRVDSLRETRRLGETQARRERERKTYTPVTFGNSDLL